jgi:hypothetical protein
MPPELELELLPELELELVAELELEPVLELELAPELELWPELELVVPALVSELELAPVPFVPPMPPAPLPALPPLPPEPWVLPFWVGLVPHAAPARTRAATHAGARIRFMALACGSTPRAGPRRRQNQAISVTLGEGGSRHPRVGAATLSARRASRAE